MPSITLRKTTNNDYRLLLEIYASTREAELSLSAWSLAEKNAFINMQFQAQHQYYTSLYKDNDFYIVLYNHQLAGRIYSAELDHEIRIVDIALLPDYQRIGIGSYLIKQLIQRALRCKKNITLHVDNTNSAMSWYQKLGFKPMASNGIYTFMTTQLPFSGSSQSLQQKV